MRTIAELITQGIDYLGSFEHIDCPETEAELLLGNVIDKSRAYLIAHGDYEVSEQEVAKFGDFLAFRQREVPVAYLLGRKEFWSMELEVNNKVLIPRPDTEILVERVLHRCSGQDLSIVDLGTGCGAIALAIATEMSEIQVIAVDNSEGALTVAKSNCRRLGIDNVEFLESDWFTGLGGMKFNLVASNPPYIDPVDPHLLGELRFEPPGALVSDNNGLDDLTKIIQKASEYLNPGGWLLVEHGYQQAQAVTDLFHRSHYKEIRTYRDLAGNDRVTEGQYYPL